MACRTAPPFVVLLLLLGLAAASPAPAPAAFPAPVELGHGTFGVNAVAATDAAGASVAVLDGVSGGTKVVERSADATAWAAPVKLPGRALGKVAGPVVAAAGQGAAAIAWRIDSPQRYRAIAALVRDPGSGAFGAPVVVSGEDADGVRHPALAVDGAGGVLLAYNTGTRAVHLSLKGGIAVVLRRAGGSFAMPVVVDATPASPPAVALASDGTGVVAWVRERRVWAVSVDVGRGTIGTPAAVTAAGSYGSLEAAAGPGGAATLAFRQRGSGFEPYSVAALRRPAGRSFRGRVPQVVERIGKDGYLNEVAIAADESGRVTLAWSPERFGQDRKVGMNGVTSTIRTAVAGPSAAGFGRPRGVEVGVGVRGSLLCSTPSVAAAAGGSSIAYTCRNRTTIMYFTSTSPQPIFSAPALSASYAQTAAITTGLDTSGLTTLVLIRPDPPTPDQRTPTIERVLTTTGR